MERMGIHERVGMKASIERGMFIIRERMRIHERDGNESKKKRGMPNIGEGVERM